ncbi:glycoside hydrolase family 5 protein [Blastopirellula marina]|uniref:Cellulase n=1 Tax=Blastopirellula marina DSM 3645 TaxID=314230 RepID=A3ZTW0_9BACT|nr:glycoside hydrolase family 5 protein [Blastopirellula marina]EAQ80017.1 cellulase [Blastopirellula marina DSM 3645]
MKLNRRRFCQATTASLGLWGLGDEADARSPVARPSFRITLNLAGAEFGADAKDFSQQNPGVLGRDYTFNNQATVQYFCQRGVKTFRIPFNWERLQPKLQGPLDDAYLGGLQQLLRWIADAGGSAILDLHNYGRYRLFRDGRPVEAILGQTSNGRQLLTVDDWADLWRRLAKRLIDDPTVVAYGIMNEPHDMQGLDWIAASNNVVAAIREIDALRWISVGGADWSSSQNFVSANGGKNWIRDPSNRTIYEAHAYFDADRSGKYQLTFEQELARDPDIWKRPQKVLQPFLTWCRTNGVFGYVGEIGVPNTGDPWRVLLADAIRLIKTADCAVGYWAAGDWWNDYPLSVQPKTFDAPLPAPLAITVENMR